MENHVVNQIYIDGEFVTPHGTEVFDLYNPATGQVIGQVQLADEVDAEAAVAAAKRALPAWSATSKDERIDALRRLQSAVAARRDEMWEAAIVEYGAPPRNSWMVDMAISTFSNMITTLETFEFTRQIGKATVEMAPRRCGPYLTVELRCILHLRQARRGSGSWLHRRHQAQ
jgi:aldehyde dehydrogenase (NAD+)